MFVWIFGKSCLLGKMWKKLVNTDYFILFGKDLKVCVTDYMSIWRVQFSEASFLACLKDSNFGLEINESELVQKGRQMLTNPEGLKNVRLQEDGNTLVVTLAKSFGFPLRLQMKLTEGSKELFYMEITLQLLNTIQNLHTSQRELRNLLQKKDLEIEEYKCEGGEIALKFLKTTPFNDEGHMLKYPVYNEYFGAADVPDCLLNKSVEVPEVRVVKTEASVANVESNGPTPAMQTETPNLKPETAEVKSEDTINPEPVTNIKEELKSEPLTQTQSPSRLLTRPGVIGPSPSKQNKRKLNL